jgi:hypothetical protein
MRCTRDMTVSGVIAASGETIKLADPVHAKNGDRVCYGMLLDGTPVVFVGTDTPIFEQARNSQLDWADGVLGVAIAEEPKPTPLPDWSLHVVGDADAGARFERVTSRRQNGQPVADLRLVSSHEGVSFESDAIDHRGFLSLAITANVINLTVNAIAAGDQLANLPADIAERLLIPLRRNA